MKLLEIRELFGLGSDSGVTKAVSRLNARMEKERELVSCYNVLCRDLTPKCFFLEIFYDFRLGLLMVVLLEK